MKHFSHLNTATQLIQQYDGKEPFHLHIKHFFGQHTKYGSQDRKRIAHYCFCFFRIVNAFNALSLKDTPKMQEVMLLGVFFCSNYPVDMLQALKPEWNEKVGLPINEKEAYVRENGIAIELSNIFPISNEVSNGIVKETFSFSHLYQPNLFLRIRPGYHTTVIEKLRANHIEFELLGHESVALPNGTKIDSILKIDREVVVQDLSSQMIGNFLLFDHFPKAPHVWDCCAASGGKSILAKDVFSNLTLTVSDVRASILANLKRRFEVAGIDGYTSFVTDLSMADMASVPPGAPFDVILADLPCTGSGTWGRTPERLLYFDPSTIEKYSTLQKKIAVNTIPHLKKSGKFLYSTCSAFARENEEVVEFIVRQFSMRVERFEVIKGYTQRADTMFAALLTFG